MRGLKFKSNPDYTYMISLFESIAIQYGFKNDRRLDWTDYQAGTTTKVTTQETTQHAETKRKGEKSEKVMYGILK